MSTPEVVKRPRLPCLTTQEEREALKRMVEAGHHVLYHRCWANGSDYVTIVRVDLSDPDPARHTAYYRGEYNQGASLYNNTIDSFVVRKQVRIKDHPDWNKST